MKSIHSAPYVHLLELLVERRNAAGLTQSQVAERLGRPQSYVSKFERGERRLDVIEFLEVCRHLETDPYELLRDVEGAAPQLRE
ncbi:helix-turn-helix domain-containing protein [Pseudomonas lundensis]|uniref:helix-turn-helix domain-containing protein n=1 Tax=Pseudomonas lundensis TaxID=86185 RepID=UPI001472889F|nr:helix-turn-helix transcriptional regulator [Pseudomonas lundensis]NNA18819.1 helix-turn-helix transcriptional regulator [Pseudomonas lundensis]